MTKFLPKNTRIGDPYYGYETWNVSFSLLKILMNVYFWFTFTCKFKITIHGYVFRHIITSIIIFHLISWKLYNNYFLYYTIISTYWLLNILNVLVLVANRNRTINTSWYSRVTPKHSNFEETWTMCSYSQIKRAI